MNKYTKINEILNFSDIHPADHRFILSYILELEKENQKLKRQYCERTDCGGRLGSSKKVEELIKENEKLNHYKLLYQKVKDRNDKAVEYIYNNSIPTSFSNPPLQLDFEGNIKDLLKILEGEK